ncbi:MAG: hypothetical protein AAFV29_08650 [Myxococcota bacterium]
MAKSSWLIAAFASLLFLAYTLWVISVEGFIGLIAAHEANAWALQIFIDLVIALLTGLIMLTPRARRVGINVAPYAVLTVLTGSIGFLALVAHILFLETRRT